MYYGTFRFGAQGVCREEISPQLLGGEAGWNHFKLLPIASYSALGTHERMTQ